VNFMLTASPSSLSERPIREFELLSDVLKVSSPFSRVELEIQASDDFDFHSLGRMTQIF
jgi:hypothetical protein